ncbi:DNA-methyltransferase [Clostridium sp.]|uniref:DNA-methyltransferase n=1 Tax=Clostridium sp. TaxID=1506 RepID=UPI003F2D820F
MNSDYINKIYNNDCLDGMASINDDSIDCIICDLPYGTTWAKWDKIIDFNELWKQYNRIIKQNGAIVLFSSQPFTTKLIESNIKNYKYTWYWVKNIKGNYLNAKRQPLRQVEEINVFNKHNYYPQGLEQCNKISTRGSVAKTTMNNYSNEWYQENTGYPSNVLYYDLDKDKYHPTQKPVELLEYLIKTYTNEGDLVLDNCIGSGSTAVACVNTNRNYIGFELDEKYFNISKERLKNLA